MATSNQDTNIKDVAAPASATTTNIGHVLGLNAAKTQDVLIPLSMLRTVIAAELKTALAAITSGSPDVPVLDGNNLKYMTLTNFAKVVGGLKYGGSVSSGTFADLLPTTQVRGVTSSYIPSDAPSNDSGFIVNINLTSDAAFQLYLTRSHAYSRISYYASGWQSWVTLG